MRLLRHGSPGREKPAVLAADGKTHDLSGIITNVAGEFLLPEWIGKLRNTDVSALPVVQGRPRIGPCVGGVGKFICIGLNYSDHAKEAGMALPVEPVIFMKATSSICGPATNSLAPGQFRIDEQSDTTGIIGFWHPAANSRARSGILPLHRFQPYSSIAGG